MSRTGDSNADRFPYRTDEKGRHLCRVCGKVLKGRKTSFCDKRCLRDFFMKTDWQRVRRVIYERDGGECMICGEHIKRGKAYHVDHIMSISKGGAEFDLENLQLACPECNLKKSNKV